MIVFLTSGEAYDFLESTILVQISLGSSSNVLRLRWQASRVRHKRLLAEILRGECLDCHVHPTDIPQWVRPSREMDCHDDVEVVTLLNPLDATSLLSESSKHPMNETAADMDFMWGQNVARSLECNIMTPEIIKDNDHR